MAGELILIVEDNEKNLKLVRDLLRVKGYRTLEAETAERGIALAAEHRPDLILMDVQLPGMDGLTALGHLKAESSTAAIPVVIVSMLDERGKGFALGAAEYLVKPVKRDDLLAALRRFTATLPGLPRGGKVLAIDDDPLAVELIEAVLRPQGYTVLKALNGADGLALARRERPALVILDLMMPEVDGFAVVERLREDPTTANIPIVILTSKSMTAEEKARLNGRISYLAQKGSFDRGAFVELVRGFCPAPIT